MIFEIFDSSISKDNRVSKQEFRGCLGDLEYLGTHLELTEEDFDKALEGTPQTELTFQLFMQYLIKNCFITVLVQNSILL